MNAFIGLLVTVFCSPSRTARGCSCKRAQSVVQAANEVAHPAGADACLRCRRLGIQGFIANEGRGHVRLCVQEAVEGKAESQAPHSRRCRSKPPVTTLCEYAMHYA
jgi:hypothetical protein